MYGGEALGVSLETFAISVSDGVLTIGFAEGAATGLTTGTFTLAIHNGNWGYSQSLVITLADPVPVSATVATQNIEVYQGGSLRSTPWS